MKLGKENGKKISKQWIFTGIVLAIAVSAASLKNPVSAILLFLFALVISPVFPTLLDVFNISLKKSYRILLGVFLCIAALWTYGLSSDSSDETVDNQTEKIEVVSSVEESENIERSIPISEEEGQQELQEPEEPQESLEPQEDVADSIDFKVHFFDVGQGDCTLVESEGQYLLIDAGPDDCGTKIQKYLLDLGVEKIDYWVLTHPDADHIGSADVIATKFDIGKVYMSSYVKDNDTYHKMIDAFKADNIGWQIPALGDSFELGDATVTVLHTKEYEDPNNSSLCIKVSCGDTSFLFAGDAEELAEKDMISSGNDLSATVLHLSHHGSYTSSSQDFLDAVSPKYAVVSCKKDNEYGHPHQETVDKLREKSIALFRTDVQGSITASLEGEEIEWSITPVGEYVGGSSDLEKNAKNKQFATLDSTDAEKNNTTVERSVTSSESSRNSSADKKDDKAESDNSNKTSVVEKNNDSTPAEYMYIGNKSNMKLHKVSCSGQLPIESNREYFYTLEDALAAGYTKEEQCKRCYPYGR